MSSYPESLPGPSRLGHKPKPRNFVTDLEGPAAYLNRERDQVGTIEVEFFFTAEQAAVFYAWWRDELEYGGMAFNCTWPAIRPGAMVAQFLAEPIFEHVYQGAHRISGVVSVRGPSLAVRSCIPDPYYNGVAGDPYFENVVLLLHGDGADGGATFTDSSSYARIPSLAQFVNTVTTAPKFGSAAIERTAANAALDYASSTDFSLPQNFTLEFWVKTIAGGASYLMGSSNTRYLEVNNAGTTISLPAGYGSFAGATGIVPGAWTHVAFSRNGTTSHSFTNGVLIGTFANTTTSAAAIAFSPLHIPGRTDLAAFTGQLDDIRYTQGICRYTGNFVVPSMAFPDFYEAAPAGLTVLSLHGESIVDSSSEPKSLAVVGLAAASSAQKKFGEKSLAFLSSTDAITSPSIADFDFPGDFTLECWVYQVTATGPYARIIATRRVYNSIGAGTWRFGYGGWQKLVTGAVQVVSVDWPLNEWHHVAISRASGVMYAFLDGVLAGSAADTTNYTNTSQLRIGHDFDAAGTNTPFGGYIDDLRITKGAARYTSNFTPPPRTFCDRA